MYANSKLPRDAGICYTDRIHLISFNMTYWTYIISSDRFSLEKCGKIWKNRPFLQADMAGLGSIGKVDNSRNMILCYTNVFIYLIIVVFL